MKTAVFVCALLVGCGGGDSPAPCEGHAQALTVINDARSHSRNCGNIFYPATPGLIYNESLTQSALSHVADMSNGGFVAHNGTDQSTPQKRAERFGYPGPIGENVVSGFMNLSDAMGALLASPVHCQNIMDPRMKNFGSACSPGAEPFRVYWAMEFGI